MPLSKQVAIELKLFCIQENLTWYDLDFDDETVREINRVLETTEKERDGA